jgi:hypothetical protein
MATIQDLSDVGLNPFGAVLLAESLLRHPKPIPVEFVLPIRRSDCPGWSGVKFALTPIATDDTDTSGPAAASTTLDPQP